VLPLKLIFESWIDRISISRVYKKATGLKLSALSAEEWSGRGELGWPLCSQNAHISMCSFGTGRVLARLGVGG
jgi:hypothetical protein